MFRHNFVGESLYHYTTIEGLKGIFSRNSPAFPYRFNIRFSTASRFLDKTEGQHALELFHDVCRGFFADKRSEEALSKATQEIQLQEEALVIQAGDINSAPKDILPRREPLLIDIKHVETFIACFSDNEDNHALWHMGEKDNHFAIELYDQSGFQSWLPTSCIGEIPFQVCFERVIYDDIVKKQRIEDDLHFAYQKYRDNKEAFIVSLKQSLSEYQYLFKNNIYSEEAETRAIINIDNLDRVKDNGIKVETVDCQQKVGQIL